MTFMVLTSGKQQPHALSLNLHLLRYILAVGATACLLLTLYFHSSLDVDSSPSSASRANPQTKSIESNGNPYKWWPKANIDLGFINCIHSAEYPDEAVKAGALFDTKERCCAKYDCADRDEAAGSPAKHASAAADNPISKRCSDKNDKTCKKWKWWPKAEAGTGFVSCVFSDDHSEIEAATAGIALFDTEERCCAEYDCILRGGHWRAATNEGGDALRLNKNAGNNDNNEGLSACLLVNDENPRLPEWLAYHYLTLPLRSLIITVDPASRSHPNDILLRFHNELGLEVKVWSEKKFLPPQMRGPCNSNDTNKCLWHHRQRQQVFVVACMKEFKRMNRTWVLLTDVDEYIVFNQMRGDDPMMPLDEAPEGVPTMGDWRFHKNGDIGNGGIIDGTIDGKFTTRFVFTQPDDEPFSYGRVVKDHMRKQFFLRDDIAFHEAQALHEAPPGIPTLKDPWFAKSQMYVRIYNDTYDHNTDGQFMPIPMGWQIGDEKMRKFAGGSLITDINGREYYVEFEPELWPRRISGKDSAEARRRLPSVGRDMTVFDVLRREQSIAADTHARGGGTMAAASLGPCLSMPRLLYGSRENIETNNGTSNNNGYESMAPEGFHDEDFVTLRYRWHASKGSFDASKYGKTIIDVSRIPKDALKGEALNIHRPLTYHCRKDPVRYAIALFRVNHYLDSYEAYSYRNDARSNLRQCKECYEKKGSGAAVAMDDDIRPWLRKFVETVGHEKAKVLLSNAGDFVKLD